MEHRCISDGAICSGPVVLWVGSLLWCLGQLSLISLGDEKSGSASTAKAKEGVVHSVGGYTRGLASKTV